MDGQPEKLQTIASFNLAVDADLLKFELEKEGFTVFLADATLVSMDPLLGMAVGGIKVQVPDSQVKMATSVVAKWQQGRVTTKMKRESLGDVAFNCEECGKSLKFPGARRGGVETCPHCKKYIDVPD